MLSPVLDDPSSSDQVGTGIQGGHPGGPVLANTPILAGSVEPSIGLADSSPGERDGSPEGDIRPHGIAAGDEAPRLLHLWNEARSQGVSRDAWEYGMQVYKLSRAGKSATLSTHECSFRKYGVFRASGIDLAPLHSVASVMSASVWLVKAKIITEGGIGKFLSAFADVTPALATDVSAKRLRIMSKRNQKVFTITSLCMPTTRMWKMWLILILFSDSERLGQERTVLRHT